jgi:CheY-like chemotaxis protein
MDAAERMTIVVIDDDEGHVELVRRSLRRTGIAHELVCFDQGREALDYLMARGPQAGRSAHERLLVLLDINMPGLDGVEVLRELKAQPETRQLPVIMLTTTDDPREVSRCYELGCNVYVVKPVQPDAFADAVRRLGLFASVTSLPGDPAGST